MVLDTASDIAACGWADEVEAHTDYVQLLERVSLGRTVRIERVG